MTPLLFRKFTLTQIDGSVTSIRKATAVTASPIWVQNIMELEIRNRESSRVNIHAIKDFGVNSAVSTTLKAVPKMTRLQIVTLKNIRLSSHQLVVVLSAPELRKLTLVRVNVPALALTRLPPPSIRHLELHDIGEWGPAVLLWTHLSSSLEFLELQRFKHSDNLPPIPPCPRLHTFQYAATTAGVGLPEKQFNEFINSCPNLTHITASVAFPQPLQFDMFPSTVRYLCLHRDLLRFDAHNSQLTSLESFRITGLEDLLTVQAVSRTAHYINNHFPNLLTLELEISWAQRNHALALARLALSAHTLHLVIATTVGFKAEENSPHMGIDDIDVLWGAIERQEESAKLRRLSLDVTVYSRSLDETALAFLNWWFSVTTTFEVGFGGADLSETDVTYFCPGTSPQENDIRRWFHSERGRYGNWTISSGGWYE
jgi:hypothetical protein